jgi:hypothetical protein
MHPSDLNLFHANPRQGNVGAIAASLRANGQMKPIVVNIGTYTGRMNEVLAGNHTLKAIRDLAEQHPDDDRWQNVLVHMVDVDDDRATRFVTADNRTSELGTNDDRMLLELLSDMDDLEGTGYDAQDLQSIEDLLNDSLWDKSEESEQEDGDKDEQFFPKINMQVPPTVFDAWHELLNSYTGNDDVEKLTAHLRKTGHL